MRARTAILALWVALAAAAPPAVLAQSISPLDPPDTSQYLKWGPLWARPGFAISDLGYDNNVFGITDDAKLPDGTPVRPVGDYFIALSPRIRGLVLFGHRAFLTFDERLEFYAYAQQREIDCAKTAGDAAASAVHRARTAVRALIGKRSAPGPGGPANTTVFGAGA